MFAHKLQTPGARKARATRGGFTLVEILCVVVILGIASAIILPQIGSRSDLIASSGARVLMADLIYAQNRAISLQKPHFVRFSNQTYTVSDTTTMTAITHPVTKNPYTLTFNIKNTPLESVQLNGVGFGGTSTVLRFDEMGSPYSYDIGTGTSTPLGAAGTIEIQSGNCKLTISVEPYTGETSVSGN
jgi:prepilin-type N-terminal cleavage/methylation domain-containing protein